MLFLHDLFKKNLKSNNFNNVVIPNEVLNAALEAAGKHPRCNSHIYTAMINLLRKAYENV